MTDPVLYDAVTLRHFGAIGRFDILETCHGHLMPPRWTEAVAEEIKKAAAIGQPGCKTILEAAWLLSPLEPQTQDLKAILQLQIGLNEGKRPPTAHAGEAEGIYFAEKLGGRFITDDNGAHDFATRRLGPGRVQDTVDLLRGAVAMGDLLPGEAHIAANAIRNCGRHLRRVHPSTFPPNYF